MKLVAVLMDTFLVEAKEQSSEIIGKIIQLMLCILDGLHSTCNMVAIVRVSQEWAPAFESRNPRYFIMNSVDILESVLLVPFPLPVIAYFSIFGFFNL